MKTVNTKNSLNRNSVCMGNFVYCTTYIKNILISFLMLFMLSVSSVFATDENSSSKAQTDPIHLNLCYVALSSSQSVFWYAYENDIFKKHGIEATLTFIKKSASAVPALFSGEVDFCQISGSAVVNSVAAGIELELIMGMLNTYTYSFMVSPEIETASDLKGKTIAINSFGGAAEFATRSAVESLNLDPDIDVKLLSVGGHSARLSAMEIGQVAGTVISVPQTLEAKERGYRELVDMSTLGVPYQHTGVAGKKSFINDNPVASERLVKALTETIALMKADKNGTAEVIAQYLLMDMQDNIALLDESHEKLIVKYLQKKPYPTREGIQAIIDRYKKHNGPTDVVVDDIANMQFVEKLDQSGFIQQLYSF